MKTIEDCGLPLPIQKLYIKRLKHMIWRWECENFCGHCPVTKRFGFQTGLIKEIKPYNYEVCVFCVRNVELDIRRCPCYELQPKQALKRAKDFIERFELEKLVSEPPKLKFKEGSTPENHVLKERDRRRERR